MILDRVRIKLDSLSSGQRAVARFLLETPREAAFLTAAQIGDRVGVSESTVIRLAFNLGYPGFPELKNDLQKVLQGQLSALERHQSYQAVGAEGNLAQRVLREDLGKAATALSQFDDSTLSHLAAAICQAPAVLIFAQRSARSLALFFESYLSWFHPAVHILDEDLYRERILASPEGSLVLGISFPRYTRRTVECLEFAYQEKKVTAAITDSLSSPLARHSQMTVTVPCPQISFIDSFVVPMSLLNALLLQVTRRMGDEARERLEKLEGIWKEDRVYQRAER